MGWETLKSHVHGYTSVPDSEVKPVGRYAVNSVAAMATTARCAKTDDLALEIAERDLLMFAKIIINDLYAQLAERSPDEYAGFDRVTELRDHVDDPEWLRNCGPTVIVGGPEHCIQQIQRVKEMGCDEIVLRIDNGSHDEIMSSLEHFGRYVIPYFTNPTGVLRDGVIGLLPGDPRQVPSYDHVANRKTSA
jgi:alkanesulfonate monooxygenase SsuD/methylene tetrahydromethanopterin reductase-like flavin-dependent oxidoreductase (luciferase family)